VNTLSLSPDGRFAISGSNDQTLRVWNIESGECLRVLEGHEKEVSAISVTPDGCFAVSRSDDYTLRFWDLGSGNTVALFFLRGIWRFKLDWSRRRLVVGFSDGRVEFYWIENLILGPIITTAQRELVSEDLPAGPVTARPVCCGEVIEIPPILAERIEHWHLAGLDRDDRAYTDTALLFDCPSCGTPLRMNPFFVDIRPWSID
jgi:WD40 repeat protein